MHETAINIISAFKACQKELSTSQILENIDQSYKQLKNQPSQDKEKLKSIKRELAIKHRKVLHHINKLIEKGILRQVKHGNKGEKFFDLNLDDGEILDISPIYRKKKAIETKLPSMPIEGYEQKGLIYKYEPGTFIDRINSAVIFGDKIQDTKKLLSLFKKMFDIVNDTVCIENFQDLINEGTKDFLLQINQQADDYGKIINLIIDLAKVKDKKILLSILENISQLNKIKFIFNINSEELQENFELFKKIIEIFAERKILFNIKNKNLNKLPYFVGRAGPYNFTEEESKKAAVFIACSQSSVIIDVNKFYLQYGLDTERFVELMMNTSKSLLSANSVQRRKSRDYFHEILQLNPEEYDILSLSRNYIRFWNFGLNQPGINPELILNMISEARKKIDEFCISEEVIYKSCGMTTRFRIALSCAFENSIESLSSKKYEHLELKGFEDLYRKDMKKKILEREDLCELFSGGNDVTFHPTGRLDSEESLREILSIINSYKIPFFSFNFEKIKGDLKLTSFLK